MTPKEKAEELIKKMYIEQNMYRSDCIACALICVEEVIKSLNKMPSKDLSDLQYWNEVEYELRNNK